MDGGTQVLLFLADGYQKIGRHPYYSTEVFGVDALQEAASRCEQQLVQFAEEAAYTQLATDLGLQSIATNRWPWFRSLVNPRSEKAL